MTQREKWVWRATALLLIAGVLMASGIGVLTLPNAVPTANKRGNSNVYQLASNNSAASAGTPFCDDGAGNTTTSGCSGGGGGGGGSGITIYSGLAGVSLSGTAFFPFGGGSIASTTESVVTVNLRAATSIANFTAHLSVALGGAGGNSVALTIRKNNADTTITCTITDPAVQCSDTTHTVSFASGDTIDIKAVFGGTIVAAPNFVMGATAGTTGQTISVSNGYLNVGSSVYCGSQLAPCTIPLSTGWTWANQGTSTVTGGDTTPLYFKFQAAGGNLRTYNRTAPGTFTVIVMYAANHIPAAGTQQNGCGITVGDGTKYLHFLYIDFSAQTAGARLRIAQWNSTTSAGGTYNDFGDGGNNSGGGLFSQMSKNIWMKLVLDSTNLTWSWSMDGVNYDQFDQRTKGDFLGTITTVGFGADVDTSVNCSLVSFSGA